MKITSGSNLASFQCLIYLTDSTESDCHAHEWTEVTWLRATATIFLISLALHSAAHWPSAGRPSMPLSCFWLLFPANYLDHQHGCCGVTTVPRFLCHWWAVVADVCCCNGFSWPWRTDRRHYWECLIKWAWNQKLLPIWQRLCAELLSPMTCSWVSLDNTKGSNDCSKSPLWCLFVYSDFQKCHNCTEIDKYKDKRIPSWMFHNIIPNAVILQKILSHPLRYKCLDDSGTWSGMDMSYSLLILTICCFLFFFFGGGGWRVFSEQEVQGPTKKYLFMIFVPGKKKLYLILLYFC